ncbi:MAG: DUF2200 family protein [Spirochaetales bacterium]|nr:DUF2200 family protein [Candidatus Physcosoma equi]
MPRTSIDEMSFGKVYSCLVAKAERKGKTREEVELITSWLTGYTSEEIHRLEANGATYRAFFDDAPAWNEKAKEIKGSICGIKVEEIEDAFAWKYRCLDKLVDELAKGKAMEKILR